MGTPAAPAWVRSPTAKTAGICSVDMCCQRMKVSTLCKVSSCVWGRFGNHIAPPVMHRPLIPRQKPLSLLPHDKPPRRCHGKLY